MSSSPSAKLSVSSTSRAELRETLPLGVRAALDLLQPPVCGDERAPRVPRLGSPGELVVSGERVEQVELVRRPSQPPLRELAGQREQPLRTGDHVLARDAPPPRVRARAAVGCHASRDDQTRLVVGPEVAKRLQAFLVEEPVRDVELRLDVRLVAGGADRRGLAFCTQEQADRLGEDRLPRACLAGQRHEARTQLELRFADQHEIVDPQSAQHERIVDQAPRP